MVEFSDFQCGYCRLFWRETLPKIEEQYIRRRKVRFVYRHMGLPGEASVLAAQAAFCAHDRGKFWQYHDTLFTKGSPLAFTSARLKRYAAELRLDGKTFAACLDSGKHAERVEAETILGHALGANGTPAFLLNGELVIGAYRFEAFQQGRDALLAKTPSEKNYPARVPRAGLVGPAAIWYHCEVLIPRGIGPSGGAFRLPGKAPGRAQWMDLTLSPST